jgi:sulfite dehydrogenase (quinone) subunit SoeC
VKPAFSVIFFTVFSGTGFGLVVWLVIGEWLRGAPVGINTDRFFIGAAFAFVFITAGMLSSTLHLANRKNAWRAMTRVRTSWLSREGVAALLFYPLAALHLWAVWVDASIAVRGITGALVIVDAWLVLLCTGMIYACLKTIPRWSTWHVPAGYFVFGHMAGLVMFCAIAARGDTDMAQWLRWCLVLFIAGLVLKSLYHAKFGDEKSLTLNDALGVKEGRTRLLDVGHTHGTFLTNEFGFRIARSKAAMLTFWAFVLAFIVPLVIVVIEASSSQQGILGLAAVLCIAGLLLERWLFFAQARHVVMLYHGDALKQ